jgi:NADH-quinone oxidoreductase subunit J
MILSVLSGFFFLFSSISLISTIMVILSDNPVYSALFLILVFFNSALLILLLDLEFLALIFVLIYIGAIMVLVLFILMMLDIKPINIYLNLSYYFFSSGLVLILLSVEFLYFLSLDLNHFQSRSEMYFRWFSLFFEVSNIVVLGFYLYTYYSFFFLVVGIILLVAMLGAISLTLENVSQFEMDMFIRRQKLFKQINTDPKDGIVYIR